MADIFKLPASSYEELIKIIKAYASEKEGTLLSLDDLSQSTGMIRTTVSGNNGFLVQVGIITEGAKKAATEAGRALGRAYVSKIEDEVIRIWKEIVSETDFLSRMISAVRIRNGMDRGNFLNHIIYSSGVRDSKQSRTGANAIIEIFKNVGILNETDGKLTVSDTAILSENSAQKSQKKTVTYNPRSPELGSVETSTTSTTGTSVVINININCNVDELDALSEKIKQLLENIR